jgi:hypothetical protein
LQHHTIPAHHSHHKIPTTPPTKASNFTSQQLYKTEPNPLFHWKSKITSTTKFATSHNKNKVHITNKQTPLFFKVDFKDLAYI